MKTKNLGLMALMMTGSVTGSFAQTATSTGSWMNSFSTVEYLLMAITCVMAVAIWMMGRTIKTLSEQLR